MKRIPRGPEWDRATLRPPDHAMPWTATGSATTVATGTEVTLIAEDLQPEINGGRIAWILIASNAGNLSYTWRFYRNGSPYDEVFGQLRIGAQIVPTIVPVFLLYQPGDHLDFAVLNQSGASRDFSGTFGGWKF
jgi:hypothetical protein